MKTITMEVSDGVAEAWESGRRPEIVAAMLAVIARPTGENRRRAAEALADVPDTWDAEAEAEFRRGYEG